MKKIFNLGSKCLAFFLSLIMIISSVPTVAFAATADTHEHNHNHADTENISEEKSPGTGVKFSDGVFTVTVDVDEIYGLIDGGSLSKEAVLDLVPAELKEAVGTDGDAAAKAEALIRAYFNLMIDNDPERLYDSIPMDMLIEYLTEEPDPLLWKIISREKLFGNLDLIAVFHELDKAGKLNEVIDVNQAADVALESGMIDDAIMKKLIDDVKKNDTEAYYDLIDAVVEIIVSDSEFDHICDAVVEDMLEDEEAEKALTDFILKKHVLSSLIKDDPAAKAKLADLIEEKNALNELITKGAIDTDGLGKLIGTEKIGALIDGEALDVDGFKKLVSEEDIKDLIVNGEIDRNKAVEFINSQGGAKWLIDNSIVDIFKAVTIVGIDVVTDKNLVDVHEALRVLGGAKSIVDHEIVAIDELIKALGGASELLVNDVIDNEMFEHHMDSHTIREIALRMDVSDVVEIFGFARIIDAVGGEKLATNKDILALINYAALVRHLTKNGYIQANLKTIISSLDTEELLKVLPTFIINYSKKISINGKTIYHKDDPKLDVNLITQAMAESIPTFDKLAVDPNNVYAFVIDWELNEKNIDIDTTKTHYTFGIKVELRGNTDRLASVFEKIASYISVVNVGDTTSVSIRIPAKVASLYLRAVNTDKLPENLRTKVVYYLSMEITEDNVQSMISDFSVDEIASIIESVDFTKVPDVAERLLDLYSDPYDRALSMAKRAVNAMTYDKLLSVAERIGVDRIESGVENNEEKISELREKVLEKIDAMEKEKLIEALRNHNFGDYDTLLADAVRSKADAFNLISNYAHKAISKAFQYAPDAIVGVKLSDYYSKDGQFGPFTKSFGFDIGPKLEGLLGSALPGDSADLAMNFLKNTEITRNVSLSIKFSDIYEASFVDKDGNVIFVTYLPVGADLSVVYGVDDLKDYYGKDWTYDGETAVTVMPAMDVRLTVFDSEHVHEFVYIKTVEPTCTEGGYELWRCECQFEEKRNEKDALGHELSADWEINYPTKDITGMAVKKCTRCGSVCKEIVLPELPDATNYFYVVTNNFDGYCHDRTITYKFLLDTDEETYTVSANAYHVWGEWEITIKPTIHDEGVQKNVCTVAGCGYTITESVPALETSYKDLYHEETGVIISGTFAKDLEQEVVVKDVDYDADVWAKADGIDKVDRIKLMDISIANLSKDHYDYAEGLTVTIPLDPKYADRDFVIYHKLHGGDIEKFATNDEGVDKKHRITVVEIDSVSGEKIPALRFTVYSFSEFLITTLHVHEFGPWFVVDEPTLDKGGKIQRECTTGDEIHIETNDIPKLNSVDYEYNYTPPTCGVTGAHVYISDEYDGQKFTFTIEVAALDHSYGTWSVHRDPTVDARGELIRKCSNCGGEQIYMLPALNETDYDREVIKPANCTSTGTDKYTLKEKVDGQTFYFEVETDKTEHSYGEWTVIQAPTCTDNGIKASTCPLCGDAITEIIPALGHSYDTGTVTKQPSCTEEGVMTF
ncbi:MAG: hypothetical protein E7677_05295, partial [Ruminococcaceae bacterium]|nr:hypothetical protein [Oscillospiraceae bacterium]